MIQSIYHLWNNLYIGTRLTIGVGIILLLTLIVGLVGWRTLESQARSQQLANQAIDLVSALRAARQDEKNYMIRGDSGHIKDTLDAIKSIRTNTLALEQELSGDERQTVQLLLEELNRYQNEFESFVELNHKKDINLSKMVTQGRELENTAVSLRDDQKKELQRLETLAVTSSVQRQEKREKADDANRMIKLMGRARQQEKNFLLRNNPRYADETHSLVERLIIQAESTRSRFKDTENQQLAGQIISAAEKYLSELNKVIKGKKRSNQALNTMITLGRKVEDFSIQLREDQKQELLNLEKRETPLPLRLDKREKADSANRIIKLMGEARQQEKNFLLRKEQSYSEVTHDLVQRLITEAKNLKHSFQDQQNQALVAQIIEAAEQYLREFKEVVSITKVNIRAQDSMASLGRKVEDLSSQLREIQKLELQRLEQISTRSSEQRLDKRIKADTANRIIKLMGEARQHEKNYLLRQEDAYAEMTRSLVSQAVRQAILLKDRFQDQQNRELANKIISAAQSYLEEFEDVVVAITEQHNQQDRMVNAARKIENLASQVRNITQQQADSARKTAVVIILTTLTLALIIGISTALVLTRSIANPIRQLIDVINQLANEDNVDVPLVNNQDEIGQIARAISNFKEVILRRKEKTEAQLIQAEKMAALGDLVAGVAHEINTPIGIAVTGSTHLQEQIGKMEYAFNRGELKKSDFSKFINNALPTADTIHSNLERAAELIRSFKQVAVDQSSQEARRFNLLKYINEVIISLRPKLKHTKHQITIDGNDRLEVETVAGALSQIITNLLMNSLNHAYDSDEIEGHIHITVQSNGNQAVIVYSDDGKGMEEVVVKRIYEPFFTTRRGSGGSGLGMSIIYNLVTQTLGGTIQCDTKPGSGSRFEISFPVNANKSQGVI